jgi:membrane protease YdiL (CAAX protease family)
MPEPAVLDHILVGVSVLVDPLYGVWAYRRLVRRVRAGVANARAAEYRKAMLRYWTWTIGLVALWLGAGRPAAALGLAAPEGVRLLVGAIITLLGLAVLYAQWRAVSRMDEKGLAPLRVQMAAFADLLPRTEREAALFRGVSITAGVCEEIVCRGYLIWYLAAFVGAWPAVFLGALLFGAGHLYQGPAGVIKTGATGLVMGILYLGTGSLLFPVILHAAVDLHGGAMARRVLGSVPSAEHA